MNAMMTKAGPEWLMYSCDILRSGTPCARVTAIATSMTFVTR